MSVEGEIAGLTKARSGHMYFTLKDENCQISCVMFQAQVRLLETGPRDGDQVVVLGELRYYTPRGQVQLQALGLKAAGLGDLYARFLRLKERLQAEGLFEQVHKKPIPSFARCLGVVTSPDGAVLHDILHTVERRFPALPVLLAPSLVQGEAAVPSLIAALKALDARPEVELIVLARGGGSLEDLWCFNNEQLVRAIFELQTPVVSAIGHETDVTLADFVADYRAPTPTAAAEMATQDQTALYRELDGLAQRATRKLGYAVENLEQSLDDTESRLRRALLQRLTLLEQECEALTKQAAALDVRGVLRRGYSLTLHQGKTVGSVALLRTGDRLQTLLADGSVYSVVQNATEVPVGPTPPS